MPTNEYRLQNGEKIPSHMTEEEEALRGLILDTRTELMRLELRLIDALSSCKHEIRYETDSFICKRIFCAVCNKEIIV